MLAGVGVEERNSYRFGNAGWTAFLVGVQVQVQVGVGVGVGVLGAFSFLVVCTVY